MRVATFVLAQPTLVAGFPHNVPGDLAPQGGFLLVPGADERVRGRGGHAVALFGFAQIECSDGHGVSLRRRRYRVCESVLLSVRWMYLHNVPTGPAHAVAPKRPARHHRSLA